MGRSGGSCGCKPANGKGRDGGMHIVVNAPDAAAFGADGLPRPPGFDPPTGKTRTVTFPDAQINGSGRVDLGGMAGARRADAGANGECCCGGDEGERPPIVIDDPPSPAPAPPRKPDDSPGTSPAAAEPRDDGARTDVACGGPATAPRPSVQTTSKLTAPDSSAGSSGIDVEMTAGRHAGAGGDKCSCAKPKQCCCCCDEESMPIVGDAPSSPPPAPRLALRPDSSPGVTAGIGGWSAAIGDGPAGEVPPYSRDPGSGDGFAISGHTAYDPASHQRYVVYGDETHCDDGTLKNWYRNPFPPHEEYYGCPKDPSQRPIVPTSYQLGGGPGWVPPQGTPASEAASEYECRKRRGIWEQIPYASPPWICGTRLPGLDPQGQGPWNDWRESEYVYIDVAANAGPSVRTPEPPPAPCGYLYTGVVTGQPSEGKCDPGIAPEYFVFQYWKIQAGRTPPHYENKYGEWYNQRAKLPFPPPPDSPDQPQYPDYGVYQPQPPDSSAEQQRQSSNNVIGWRAFVLAVSRTVTFIDLPTR